MELDRVRISQLVVGDVIATPEDVAWWHVVAIKPESNATVDVALQSLESDASRQSRLPSGLDVRRTDPAAVHHKDEFLGLSADHAEVWAAALGWKFRNHSASGVYTDEEHITASTYGPTRTASSSRPQSINPEIAKFSPKGLSPNRRTLRHQSAPAAARLGVPIRTAARRGAATETT